MNAREKVLIIGIDGLDADLISQFRKELPNFERLTRKWPKFKMQSVFPPDSPTAWASIFTGLNPAKHGIISFKDPFSRSQIGDYLTKIYNIKGKTFWDLAGKYGKKCCIIFPHLAYPPWPVNGILVSRTTEVDIRRFDIKTFPSDIDLGCDPLMLKPITSFPRNVGQIIQPTKQLILNEADFGLRLLDRFDWDVFFIYFSSLDNIEHIFWMAIDERHPAYPEMAQYRKVILDFYKFYDENVIGRFLKAAPSEATFMVVSDHGHGMRPLKIVKLNELLSRYGLLKTNMASRNTLERSSAFMKGFLKKNLTVLINERRIFAKLASKFLSFFPNSLELYTSFSNLDYENTVAYLSDSSAGLKTYSYAGIKVKNNSNTIKYEQIRKSIIKTLYHLKDPVTFERIIEWAVRREDLYQGPFIDRYPDIVFKLKDEWGIDWSTGSSLFAEALTHKLFSGTHKQDSAVFLLDHPNGLQSNTNSPHLLDVAPTILHLLGIAHLMPYNKLDGKSVVSKV